MKTISTENQTDILTAKHDLFSSLSEIDGKNFTKREIDIISCVLNGRSVKKIATLLSISSKTVESHIRNIGLKLGLSNQENIINFVEKSGKYELLKQHYINILIQNHFETELKKVNDGENNNIKVSMIFDENPKNQSGSFVKQIVDDLQLAGITVESENKKTSLKNNAQRIYCVFSEEALFNDLLYQLNDEAIETVFCLNQAIADKVKNKIGKINCVILSDFKDYYSFFFAILKTLLPQQNIDQCIAQFNKHKILLGKSTSISIRIDKSQLTTTSGKQRNWLLKKVFVTAIVCLIILGCSFVIKTTNARTDMPVSMTWNLPFPNYYFTGRYKELKELIRKFAQKDNMPVTLVACNGMGGVGKTEIAKYFVHNAGKLSGKKYRYKFWFDSEKIDKITEQYIRLAKILKIDLDGLDTEESTAKITQWLETHSDWLLVYDNAESMESIMRLLPQRGGDILITSRNPNWQTVININIMTEKEAVYLLKGIIKKPDNENDIKSLVNTLGKLPLAVAQAGAYISRKGVSVKTYLDEYAQEQNRLLMDSSMPPGNNHSSVSVTFSLSIESIKKISADAYLLINCLAYIDPNEIYRKDLELFMKKNDPKSEKTNIALDNAIQMLRDYSLISINKNETIVIHRLVQSVAWYRQRHKQENNNWLYKVLDVLNDDDSRENSQLALGLIGNKRECLDVLIAYYKNILVSKKTPILLQSLGCCYLTIDDFKNAEECFLASIALKKRSSTCCEYGMALYLQGKTNAAIQQFEDSLLKRDHYISYYGELERCSVDYVLKKLIDKYGIVWINSAHLSTYFLIRAHQDLGNDAKANYYLQEFKKIAKENQNPVFRDLIESIG